ncbi:MAG: hypothetical protein KC561_20570, partial [Myxococcales bacterium]|nr:hypothetical protein [Myxococcales bacterium]
YSMGVLLYELVAGHPPFEADSPMQVALLHVTTKPQPVMDLSRYRPLPMGLSALIMDLLEKDPADRPPDVGEVRKRLLRVARDLPGLKIEVSGKRSPAVRLNTPPTTMNEAWGAESLVGTGSALELGPDDFSRTVAIDAPQLGETQSLVPGQEGADSVEQPESRKHTVLFGAVESEVEKPTVLFSEDEAEALATARPRIPSDEVVAVAPPLQKRRSMMVASVAAIIVSLGVIGFVLIRQLTQNRESSHGDEVLVEDPQAPEPAGNSLAGLEEGEPSLQAAAERVGTTEGEPVVSDQSEAASVAVGEALERAVGSTEMFVTVEVQSEPQGASVTRVDTGQILPPTPITLVLRQDREVVLAVGLDGYITETVQF